ncbi:hypothetical protein D3C73_1046700 [compost metagenome]
MNHAGAGIIHFRQVEQIIRQLRHPLRFRFDVMQPFGLLGNGVVLVGQEYIGIRIDNGERGLQLMRGIGDELLLLVKGFPDRSDGAVRKVAAGEIQNNQHYNAN